jgi:cytochrome c oxidase assembly protein subunit 17
LLDSLLQESVFIELLRMDAAKETPCAPPKDGPVGPDGKKLKPCCACPETKRPRDECIMEKGEENCGDLIEAHKACMRALGFKI